MYVGTSSHTYGVATYLLTYLRTRKPPEKETVCVCVEGGTGPKPEKKKSAMSRGVSVTYVPIEYIHILVLVHTYCRYLWGWMDRW